MIQWLSFGLSVPLATSDHKVSRVGFKLSHFVSSCQHHTRSNERGPSLENKNLFFLLLLLLTVTFSLLCHHLLLENCTNVGPFSKLSFVVLETHDSCSSQEGGGD